MKSASDTSEARRRRRERRLIVAAAVLILLLSWTAYHLLRGSVQLPQGGNLLIFAIINLNTLLLLLLGFLVVRNLVKVVFEDRRRVLGAKLRTKLVVAFVSLSLIPTVVLFLVSLMFLSTSLKYWFDVKVEQSLANALLVGRSFYEERERYLTALGSKLAADLEAKCRAGDRAAQDACLAAWRSPLEALFAPAAAPETPETAAALPPGLHSIEFVTPTHTRKVLRSTFPAAGLPPLPPASTLMKAFDERRPVVATAPLRHGEYVRVFLPLSRADGEVAGLLALGSLVPGDTADRLAEIRLGYEDYRQLRLFQNPIKVTLLITLFLVTLLILFAATWFGFRLAKGITEPVGMLAEATHRVAAGDLDFTLEAEGRDELSSLVRAFNIMTQDLREAKRRAEAASQELRRSNVELDQRRRYMEIILHNVAAGVISIDRDGVVTTMNRSAEAILGVSAAEAVGRAYFELLTPDQVEQFDEIREALTHSPRGTLQRPVRLNSGDRLLSLLMSFTLLRDREGRSLGVVVVFDDLTELEKIQRLAAWREVARRIAHEVKNPLTPIQLSAERLRKRYLDRLDEDAREVFDRCTRVIITQVEELKRLVNEFSNFARMPSLRLRPTDLRALAEEVAALYREGHPRVTFEVRAEGAVPEIPLDRDQVKRALINLLDNAVAALAEAGTITLTIRRSEEAPEVQLEVADTGRGVPEPDKARLFEPYFSTKRGGTGLGLAIVNSIVADHNGRILVEDNVPRGTRFILCFPLENPAEATGRQTAA